MISSKIGMKPGARADQQTMQYSQGSSGMNQYAGNLQQPYPNKYQSKNVHSSQVGKKSVNVNN